MINLSKALVSNDVINAAERKGLQIEVFNTENPINPRRISFDKNISSTLVLGATGRDAAIADINLDSSFSCKHMSDIIEDYADQNHLVFGDLLCWTVYKYESGGDITLSTTLFKDLWQGGVAGFIYESLQGLREEFGVKRISTRIKSEVSDRIQSELNAVCNWSNERCYTVSVICDGEVLNSVSSYYEDFDRINEVAAKLVAELDLEAA